MRSSNKTDEAVKKLMSSQIINILIALFIYTAAGFIIYIVGINIFHFKIWYGYEPLYRILNWFDKRRDICAILYIIVGYTVIIMYFLKMAFTYLQEVANAVNQVYIKDNKLVALSPSLKSIENRLNQTKIDLIDNERIAREAEQRKNDLVTYLAHDLKTPITSIIGYLTLLQDEPDLPVDMRIKYTGIVLNKAERLEELINEFFEITRFNLSKLMLEPELINLSRMAEQITSEFIPVLAEKKLSWNTDIDQNIEIVCDPDKLERVLDNLIKNAVNYSYENTEIYFSMKRKEDSVEIIIRNRGKTIPKDKLRRIFEQFFRLDSSRASSTGGAGLGLAISKEIVELHGGIISAESEDENIMFKVTLPVRVRKS